MLGMFKTQLKKNLVLRKPLFLWRIAKHYFSNVSSFKKTTLRTMTVMINSECNCRCEHCFAESFSRVAHRHDKLTLSEMKAALKEMVNNGVYHFCLQGGEPFLHPHLNELIKACSPNKSFINITTNGTIADRKRLREVYQLGVDKIAVSIDSFFSDEHDRFRNNPGCHEKAINTLMAAKEVGLEAGIAVTVLNETIHTDSVKKLFNLAKELGINVDINIPQPVGNWDGRLDKLLTEENFSHIDQLHKQNVRIRRDLYSHIGRSGCPAVKESMHMDMFGYIYPCVYMHITIGNIKDHYLRDIRINAMNIKEFANYEHRCLSGEDRNFIAKYVSKGFGLIKPADGLEIFSLSKLHQRKEPLA